MPETRVKIIGLLILIFLLGTATGGLGYRLLQQKGYFSLPPRHHRDEVVEKFTRELGLNPSQSQQLNVILGETEEKFRELNKSVKPQADAIRQEGRNKIRAMLTAAQKPKFEEMLQKIDEERRKREEAPRK